MTLTKEMVMALVCVAACGMTQAAMTNGIRVAATIRPEGTGFGFNPKHFTYKPLNDDYEVTLNGVKAEVRASRESRWPFNRIWPGRQRPLDQTERASYLAFEGTGPVSVTVRTKGQFKGAVVRPLSAGVRPVVRDGTVAFTLATNGYYVCEVDGTARALQLFYERPREFPERDRATRPDLTIKDLEIAAEVSTADDGTKVLLPENDLTKPAETRALAKAERLQAERDAASSARVRAAVVGRLERLYCDAVRLDRVTEAEFYRRELKRLYPDWEYKPPKEEEKKEEKKE